MVEPAEERSHPIRYVDWMPSSFISPARKVNLRVWWSEIPIERKRAVLATIALVPVGFLIYKPLVIFALYALRILANRPLSEPKPTDLTGIAPVPLPDGHIGVNLAMKLAGVVYGKDSGVLTFVDGWLVFEGKLCRFSIAASDVDWRPPTVPTQLRLVNGQEIRLLPIERWLNADEFVRTDDRQLGRQVYLWQRQQAQPEGESLFPPIQAQPELDPATNLRQMIRLLVLAPVAVGLVAAFVSGTEAFSYILVVGAIIILFCLWIAYQTSTDQKRFASALRDLAADDERSIDS